MRNPNGYGTIKLMSGNRRRPYGFLVSIDGKQRLIESFETAVEAKIYQFFLLYSGDIYQHIAIILLMLVSRLLLILRCEWLLQEILLSQ